jgi:hypothetical protein
MHAIAQRALRALPLSRTHENAMHTPLDRARYADLLRVVSIGLVLPGHWLVAVVLVRDGELITGRLHARIIVGKRQK